MVYHYFPIGEVIIKNKWYEISHTFHKNLGLKILTLLSIACTILFPILAIYNPVLVLLCIPFSISAWYFMKFNIIERMEYVEEGAERNVIKICYKNGFGEILKEYENRNN